MIWVGVVHPCRKVTSPPLELRSTIQSEGTDWKKDPISRARDIVSCRKCRSHLLKFRLPQLDSLTCGPKHRFLANFDDPRTPQAVPQTPWCLLNRVVTAHTSLCHAPVVFVRNTIPALPGDEMTSESLELIYVAHELNPLSRKSTAQVARENTASGVRRTEVRHLTITPDPSFRRITIYRGARVQENENDLNLRRESRFLVRSGSINGSRARMLGEDFSQTDCSKWGLTKLRTPNQVS